MSVTQEYRERELALLRLMHAMIGETISEVEANTDRMPIMGLIRSEPARHGRVISFDAVLQASDESGHRFPILMKVEQIPSFLLGSSKERCELISERWPKEGGGA